MSSVGDKISGSVYLSQMTKVGIFKRLLITVLIYGYNTWTLVSALSSWLDSYETKNLQILPVRHESELMVTPGGLNGNYLYLDY